MFENLGRDFRLIGRKAENDRRRRVFAERQRLRQSLANQRRRIVELHEESAFRCGAIVRRKVGVEIAARQRGGRIRAVGGGGCAHPMQELADDHCFNRRDEGAASAIGSTLSGDV